MIERFNKRSYDRDLIEEVVNDIVDELDNKIVISVAASFNKNSWGDGKLAMEEGSAECVIGPFRNYRNSQNILYLKAFQSSIPFIQI